MEKDKLIAEWMNRLRTELSKCLTEEMRKVDLSRLLQLNIPARTSATTEQPAEAPAQAQPAYSDPIMPRRHQPNLCAVEGCDRPARARGLCGMHYQRAQYATKHGKATSDPPQAELSIAPSPGKAAKAVLRRHSAETAGTESMPAKCGQVGCERDVLRKGMCGKHFMEWVRTQRQLTQRTS